MVLIKVKYDAYNRTFQPLAGELLKPLEDGEIYMLIADVRLEDVKSGEAAGNRPFREDPVGVPEADAGSYVSTGERPFLVGLY
jgi:hypothetical protein